MYWKKHWYTTRKKQSSRESPDVRSLWLISRQIRLCSANKGGPARVLRTRELRTRENDDAPRNKVFLVYQLFNWTARWLQRVFTTRGGRRAEQPGGRRRIINHSLGRLTRSIPRRVGRGLLSETEKWRDARSVGARTYSVIYSRGWTSSSPTPRQNPEWHRWAHSLFRAKYRFND